VRLEGRGIGELLDARLLDRAFMGDWGLARLFGERRVYCLEGEIFFSHWIALFYEREYWV
jgi:hypothetical protein